MSDNPVFDSLYNRTLRFLSMRPRSEKEVLDYLDKKKSSQKNKTEIMRRLKEYNFVNDLDFTRWFIENRKKSSRILVLELKQKGIKKEIIDQVSEDFDLQNKDTKLIDNLIEKNGKFTQNIPKERGMKKCLVS